MQKKQYVRADMQVIVLVSSDVINASPISELPENMVDIDFFEDQF